MLIQSIEFLAIMNNIVTTEGIGQEDISYPKQNDTSRQKYRKGRMYIAAHHKVLQLQPSDKKTKEIIVLPVCHVTASLQVSTMFLTEQATCLTHQPAHTKWLLMFEA